MTNHHKYKKYKTKYLMLKKIINKEEQIINNDKKYTFYFMHFTKNFDNLMNILKTGKIYPGKYLCSEQRFMCGDQPEDEPSEYVYMNMFFENLKNISHSRDFVLLLHSKIMYENGFIFNRGWVHENNIHISKNESSTTINKKIKEIYTFLENPSLPDTIKESHGSYHHEVLFDHPIDLANGNLIGIICNYCERPQQSCDSNLSLCEQGDASEWDLKTWEKLDKPTNEPLKSINKMIKNKSYHNVKIMTRNYPLPVMSELMN